jgi:TolA-binding protein
MLMVIHEARIHVLQRKPALSDVACEHAALVRMLAGAQSRVSAVLTDHQQQITALQSQIVRLRGRAIVQSTLVAWLRESLAQLEPASAEDLQPHADAADRVICQTGCISHGGYWREQDQCRRTGKGCTLVEEGGSLDTVVPISDF